MAIIYSYQENEELRNSDMLVGTASTLHNGQVRKVTKNFTLGQLKQFVSNGNLILTTAGTSGPATLTDGILNVPVYQSDQTYVFVQSVPSTTWTITHNLNKYPSVSVVNINNVVMYGEITYLSPSQLQIEFSAGFSGKAYMN
jgi:hypothetical protein